MMQRQITTFILDDISIGIDILLVKEVYRHMAVTPVPDTPPHLAGLMNLRGKVVTVVDLNVCLNRPSSESIEEKRLLVLKTDPEIQKYIRKGMLKKIGIGNDIIGFLIDRMDDVLLIDDSDIFPPPPQLDEVEGVLIEGVIKQEEKLVLLLDVNTVLERILQVCTAHEA